jgi:hypothetical protein
MHLPDTLDEDLVDILGRPNFWCAPIAEVMRDDGTVIPREGRAEQAHVIFKLLSLYALHGSAWRSQATDWLQEARDRVMSAQSSPRPESH